VVFEKVQIISFVEGLKIEFRHYQKCCKVKFEYILMLPM